MPVYGYCRVSRPRQNIERQVRNIQAKYPTAKIIKEVHTRASFAGRKEWARLMRVIEPNDTIVFDSVSRMSGDIEEGIASYKELYRKGVELVFLNEPHINTETYKAAQVPKVELTGTSADILLDAINRYLMAVAEEQIRLAFAISAKELQDLRERTKGGLETARANGKQVGRKAGSSYETKKSKEMKVKIRKDSKTFGGRLRDNELIKILEIAPNTYYKYKREIREEMQMQDEALLLARLNEKLDAPTSEE